MEAMPPGKTTSNDAHPFGEHKDNILLSLHVTLQRFWAACSFLISVDHGAYDCILEVKFLLLALLLSTTVHEGWMDMLPLRTRGKSDSEIGGLYIGIITF